MAECGGAMCPPEVVRDDAVNDEENAKRKLGKKPAAADAEERFGITELRHRSRQMFVVRQVHAASGEQRRVQYNNSPTQELRNAEPGMRIPNPGPRQSSWNPHSEFPSPNGWIMLVVMQSHATEPDIARV